MLSPLSDFQREVEARVKFCGEWDDLTWYRLVQYIILLPGTLTLLTHMSFDFVPLIQSPLWAVEARYDILQGFDSPQLLRPSCRLSERRAIHP